MAEGKTASFTIHRKYEDAVARCDEIAGNYLHAVSGKESGVMRQTEEKDYGNEERKAEQESQPKGTGEEAQGKKNMFQQGRDWLADTWLAKAVYNDYTAGAVADVRRRVVEEGFYGKTLDDTVTRQSYGEFRKNAVPGEEKGAAWLNDKEFDAWFDQKMQAHNPDYNPEKFYGKDQGTEQKQEQGQGRGMER